MKKCVHWDISDEVMSKALESEKKLYDQHKNSPERVLSTVHNDRIGSIAQLAVNEYLSTLPYDVITSDPFESGQHSDKFDFMYDDEWCDVMGFGMKGEGYYWITDNWRMRCHNHKQKREMNNYVFVGVDERKSVIHIAGVISALSFWDSAKPVDYDEDKPERERRSWVPASLLRGFRDFYFHTTSD